GTSGGGTGGSGGASTSTGGTTGTGGSTAGTGGSGGSSATVPDAGGSDGTADTSGAAPDATGATDPGTMGNGRFMINRPAVPPEAAGRLPGVAAGMMRTIQIPAGVLPARSAQVYTPPGYVNGTPVAFMVFHDGGAYVGNFRIPTIFDNLIAAKKIPPMVGIFIPPSGNRSGEYDTVSDRYGRYVITDVFPQVERLGIKLTTDPEAGGVGGHSSGGICAFTMAWFHNDRFRRVLSNSGSFLSLQNTGGNNYDMMLRMTMPKKVIRTAMTAGTNDLACCGTTWYAANERMYKALSESGYNARYLVIQGGNHDQSNPMPTTPELIEWLWRGYPVTGPTR
ncbi:MAG TPA: alpha/beta hydrolase-fold protein, partial [Polyangia bacterium]